MTTTTTFSPQQETAISAVQKWLKEKDASRPIFRLFGFAGTGKTTIARELAAQNEGGVAYMAFTGKAALAMRKNGCDGATTIHSAIYTPIPEPSGGVRFVLNPDGPAASASLIVIDECSMVDAALASDILSFGKPILVIGDPGQLPPVSGAGYFIDAAPDAMLTEIHRQAEGNPIIQLATTIRTGGALHHGDYGKARIIGRGVLSTGAVASFDQVIVGRNVTRRSFNARIRAHLGRKSALPIATDRLVCLRNDKGKGIFNGGLFEVVERGTPRPTSPEVFPLKLTSEDFSERKPFWVKVRQEFFTGGIEDVDYKLLRHTQHFDYGYALTCHKSQGSQWSNVLAYDESGVFREDAARWLYTAVTRAQERLTLVM